MDAGAERQPQPMWKSVRACVCVRRACACVRARVRHHRRAHEPVAVPLMAPDRKRRAVSLSADVGAGAPAGAVAADGGACGSAAMTENGCTEQTLSDCESIPLVATDMQTTL